MKWKVTAKRWEQHIKVLEITALTQMQAEKMAELHLRHEKATIDAVLSNVHDEGVNDWCVENVEPIHADKV